MNGVSNKTVSAVALVVIVGIGVAYIIYLSLTWQALQADRQYRNAKIDELIDKMTPVPASPPEVPGDAQ